MGRTEVGNEEGGGGKVGEIKRGGHECYIGANRKLPSRGPLNIYQGGKFALLRRIMKSGDSGG